MEADWRIGASRPLLSSREEVVLPENSYVVESHDKL
jgi:hypothetical protein